jgi:hypothetical protein
LSAVGEGQRYNYQNYNHPDVPEDNYNLSGATLSIVACAPGATGGNLHVYFSSTADASSDSVATNIALSTFTGDWETLNIPVPSASGGFNPATILLVRIEVEAGSGFGTSWQQPETVILIDRISTSNSLFDDPFDTDFGEDSPILDDSGARPLAGSTISWIPEYTDG